MTGMRSGEAFGLRWTDVDLETGRLAVRRALIPNGETSSSASRRRSRAGARSPSTRAPSRCSRLRRRGSSTSRRVGRGLGRHRPRVHQGERRALDPETVTRYFRQAVKSRQLPAIRLHDLRHTHATLALQAGIHPKVVSERLGHATISITLDTYSHAIPAMQEEAAALIAGLVFAGE